MNKRFRNILIVILIAAFLRAWAVSLLPQDFDEPVYLQTGFDYAALIRAGNLNGVIDYPQVTEHPALVKILYAGGVLVLGKNALWTNAFYLGRAISAVFGTLAVALIAIAVDPLSGGMLAVHTLAVKYTSQVYLEALPSAMTIAAILAFLRIDKSKPHRWMWFLSSAIALGIATASKYSYFPVAIIVLGYLAIFEKRIPWHWLIVYALISVGTFLLLDISLWHDPIHRLIQSMSFHVQYSQGAHVQEVGYPWYQPFIWIFTSPAADWHPNVFFYYGFDGLIAILAVVGLPREWKNRRWLVVWFSSGLLFLLLWPTKWPQYALILTPALCLMGAETLRRIWKWLREQESYWEYLHNLLPIPTKWFWLAVGAFLLFIAMIYLSAAVKLAVGKVGWSHMTAQNTFLPSNKVNDLLPLQDGRMLIATDDGAAIYTPSQITDQPGIWIIFNKKNSGLTNNHVLSLARDNSGILWFGTASGLDRYDGQTWTVFHASSLGLSNDQIVSLATDNLNHVFAGTLAGASVWNGSTWKPLNEYGDNWPVFTLATSGDNLWIGTAKGAWQVTISKGQENFFQTTNAVKHILISTDGTVWAATSGSGLAKFENGSWQYFTSTNSGLPLNLVNCIEEVEPGKLWLGTSLSTSAGGELATFDGKNWAVLNTDNSGASGAEPLTIVSAVNNQVWIGTASRGLDIYKLGR